MISLAVTFHINLLVSELSFGVKTNGSCEANYLELDLDPINNPSKRLFRLCGNITGQPLSYMSYHHSIKLTIISKEGWSTGQSYQLSYSMGE